MTINSTTQNLSTTINEQNVKLHFVTKNATVSANGNVAGGYSGYVAEKSWFAEQVNGTLLAVIPLGAVGSTGSDRGGEIFVDGYGSGTDWNGYFYVAAKVSDTYKCSFMLLYK